MFDVARAQDSLGVLGKANAMALRRDAIVESAAVLALTTLTFVLIRNWFWRLTITAIAIWIVSVVTTAFLAQVTVAS